MEKIPHELKTTPRWLFWKMRGDKKVPHGAHGKMVNPLDRNSWISYEDALFTFELDNDHEFDGIGFVFDASDNICGIDLDDCIFDGVMSDTALSILADIPGYAEISPSGNGLKIFTRGDLSINKAKKYKEGDPEKPEGIGGVEVYYSQRYFTVTGQQLNGHEVLPSKTVEMDSFVEKYLGETNRIVDVETALAELKSPLDNWDIARVKKELLPYIEEAYNLDGYDDWLKVGQMLHHQGRGDDDWLELWDEISQESTHYDRGEIEAKWASFERSQSSKTITLASMVYQVNEVKKNRPDESRVYIEKLAEVESTEQLLELMEEIRDRNLPDLTKGLLEGPFKAKFRELGSPISMPLLREQLSPAIDNDNFSTKPDWVRNYVYLIDGDRFFDLTTKQQLTQQGFNASHNKDVGGLDATAPASRHALEIWEIPICHSTLYFPTTADTPLITYDGLTYANTFRPESFTSTDADMAYYADDVTRLEQHIANLIPDEKQCEVFLDWMAYVCQNPGSKVSWAPIIKGAPGDGKTTISNMLRAVMGHSNFKEANTSMISSSFNDWAVSSCFITIEEIKVSGQNRYEIMDTLKPLISNETISVHPKGGRGYTTINSTNYLALTNHEDAIPVDEADRRWWVLFTPFKNRNELPKAGMDREYFAALVEIIKQRPESIAKWLLTKNISVAFNPTVPPESRFKKLMQENAMTHYEENELSDIIDQIIEEDLCSYITKDVISSTHLKEIIEFHDIPNDLPKYGKRLTKMIQHLGYKKYEKRVNISRRKSQLFVKDGFNVENWLDGFKE